MHAGADLRRKRQLNTLGDMDVQRAPVIAQQQDQLFQQDQQQYQQGQASNEHKQILAAAQWVRQSQTPKAAVAQNFPELAQKIPNFAAMSDDDVRELADGYIEHFSAQLGMAPAQPESYTLAPGAIRMQGTEQLAGNPAQGENSGYTLGPGQQRFDANGQLLASAPNSPAQTNPDPPVAVLGPDGKPTYVSRQDSIGRTPYEKPSGGLSPRDATTARNKLSQISLARQQVALAREKFNAIKGSFSAGPAGNYLPTQAGQAFDAAVDTMRSTITGIMRVPGVGSMSDYESRLDQAKMPSRGKYEATTVQQLDSLDQMLNGLEQGYSGILGDAGEQSAMGAAPGQSQQQGNVAPEGTVISNGQQTLVKRNGQWVPQ